MATDQAKHLLEAALERGPSDRAAFLQGLGAADPDLRREVESLLAAEDDSFIEKLRPGEDSVTVDKSTAIKPLTSDTNVPGRIGPYRILRGIGEGGMGVVYEAEQQKPVRRKVALKLIKWGMDTKQVIARFESERQALALMNHPNIASVYDAGATEEGRPYFAMEYVQGIPITEYCDKHRLAIKDRLELFIQACEGVQHAHQKGIIHRDIKPSNVLVAVQDDKPVPKIIDFGVAKATSQRLTEHTVATELGQLIGTPEYMSPEQAEMTNLDIDTRTDVYSLGVLLYELLVGAQPFDPKELRAAGLVEIQRKLREDEPPRPSTRVSGLADASSTSASNRQVEVRALERKLKGDLDWITMKALEKDRTRRYETANALGLDVERYLNSEPIRARAPSASYRFRKFVRRHKAGVATGVVAVIALLLGLALAAMGLIRAREAERIAALEADTAREVSDFLVGLFEVSDPGESRGNSITAREILDKGAEDIERIMTDQPEVQARLSATMGKVYTNLGLFTEAEGLLHRAVDTQRRILGDRHPSTVSTMNDLANLYLSQQRYDDAETLYVEVVEARKRLFGEEHPDTLAAKFDLASLYIYQLRLDEAEPLALSTLEAQRRVLGDEHPAVAGSLNNLAALLHLQGRYDEAEPLFREALSMARQQLGARHPNVAVAVFNLARLLGAKEEYDTAETMYREALQIEREVLDPQHPLLGTTLSGLAAVLDGKGDSAAAAALHDEACTILSKSLGPDAWMLAQCRSLYGVCLVRLARFEHAEELLLAAYPVLQAQFGKGNERTQRAARGLSVLYEAWGKPEKAAEYRAQLAAIQDQEP